MRTAFFALATLLMTVSVKGQIRYQKVSDDPDDAINTMINIVPVDTYIPSGKNSALTIGIGVSGVYGFTSPIGFEGNLSSSYLSTNGGSLTIAEGGAFLNFRTKTKTKNTRVLLSYERTSGVSSRVETVKYIEVPATVKISTGLRGGLAYHSGVIETDGIKSGIPKAVSDFTLTGIYAGLQTTNKHLIKTQLQNEKEATPTGAIFKLYADVLFFPLSKLSNPVLEPHIKTGNIGGRGGMLWVVAPYIKKMHPRYRPILHRLNISTEIGSKPIDGFYARIGCAWGVFYR